MIGILKKCTISTDGINQTDFEAGRAVDQNVEPRLFRIALDNGYFSELDGKKIGGSIAKSSQAAKK